MKKSSKSSSYIRKLNKKQIQSLQSRYKLHIKRTRQGFLSNKVLDILLRKKHFTRDEDKSQFFYDIREHAKSAFGDLMLLIETLDDSQIKEIFETRYDKNEDKMLCKDPTFAPDSFLHAVYLLFNTEGDDKWRAMLGYYCICIIFEFLKKHSYISTKAHERTLDEALNLINVEISRVSQLPQEKRTKGFA